MTVKFGITPEQAALIDQIVKRDGSNDPLTLHMDLCAVHANGCPLDFGKLLAFSDGDFLHDIRGIQRHINRRTGALGDCFDPRCSISEAEQLRAAIARRFEQGG